MRRPQRSCSENVRVHRPTGVSSIVLTRAPVLEPPALRLAIAEFLCAELQAKRDPADSNGRWQSVFGEGDDVSEVGTMTKQMRPRAMRVLCRFNVSTGFDTRIPDLR